MGREADTEAGTQDKLLRMSLLAINVNVLDFSVKVVNTNFKLSNTHFAPKPATQTKQERWEISLVITNNLKKHYKALGPYLWELHAFLQVHTYFSVSAEENQTN